MLTPNPPPPLPKSRLLRWLMDAGPHVPLKMRSMLLGEMVASPKAALAGPLSGAMMNAAAIYLQAGIVFQVLICLELFLLAVRITVMWHAARNTARDIPTQPDLYLIVAIAWCALEGSLGFASMVSGIRPLQILVAIGLMGLMGPITARTYGAERYSILLISLVYLPLVAGAQLCHEALLFVLVLQIPLFYIGTKTIIERYRFLSITALMAQEESQHRALHDSLTELTNRLGLAVGLSHYKTSCQPFVIFYIDLDGFKPVNDKFGHWAGDLILIRVAERLRSCSRKTDIVARIGGDEFVVVAPSMSSQEAIWTAERLIRSIADEPYSLDGVALAGAGPVRIGASVGFACAPEDGTDIDELQRRADAALYCAKRAGKGVGRRFGEPADPGLGISLNETASTIPSSTIA